jgi:hypothetical protein
MNAKMLARQIIFGKQSEKTMSKLCVSTKKGGIIGNFQRCVLSLSQLVYLRMRDIDS